MDNMHPLANNNPDVHHSSNVTVFKQCPQFNGFPNPYEDASYITPDHHAKHLASLPNREHLTSQLQMHFGNDPNQMKPLLREGEGSSRDKLKHPGYTQHVPNSLASPHLLGNSHLHHLQPSSYSAASIGSEYIPNAHSSSLKHHQDMQLVAAHLKLASDFKFTPPNSSSGMAHMDPFNVLNPVYGSGRQELQNNDVKTHIYKNPVHMNEIHTASAPIGLDSYTAAFTSTGGYADQEIGWKHIGLNSPDYVPTVHDFTFRAGPVNTQATETPLQIFRRLMDEEVVALIIKEMNDRGRKILNEEVTYTNKKSKKVKSENPKKVTEWVDIDSREFWSFIGIMLYMSVVKIPCIRRYWNKEMWGQPVVQEFMNRDRFCVLLRCLEYADITEATPNDFQNLDRVVPLIKKMCENFRNEYNPEEQLCLERSILQANGKFKYKNKPSDTTPEGVPPVGIKSYLLCEAKSGYVLDFFVHTGKTSDYSSDLGEKIYNATYTDLAACKLMANFTGKGHTLFTDAYYTNPILFAFLSKEATVNCVGVANNATDNYPDAIKPSNSQIGKGETVNMIGDVFNSKLLAQTWRLKEEDQCRHVLTLSTKHPPCTKVVAQKHKGYLHKPVSHLEYKDHIGALDKLDQTCGIPLPGEEGPQSKFPYKLVIRFFNIIIHNAYVIWRQYDPKSSLGYGTQFRLAVMKELKEEFDKFKKQMTAKKKREMSEEADEPLHVLTKTPFDKNKRRIRRKCVHCVNAYSKKTTTNHECKECNEGFCKPCFENVHSKLDLM